MNSEFCESYFIVVFVIILFFSLFVKQIALWFRFSGKENFSAKFQTRFFFRTWNSQIPWREKWETWWKVCWSGKSTKGWDAQGEGTCTAIFFGSKIRKTRDSTVFRSARLGHKWWSHSGSRSRLSVQLDMTDEHVFLQGGGGQRTSVLQGRRLDAGVLAEVPTPSHSTPRRGERRRCLRYRIFWRGRYERHQGTLVMKRIRKGVFQSLWSTNIRCGVKLFLWRVCISKRLVSVFVQLSEADQELYKNFPLVVSERWQQEVAETVFETINQDTDKIEQKKKNKPRIDEMEENCE